MDGDGTIVGVDQYDIVSQEQAENIDFYACISNWNSDPEVNNFDPELARVAIVTQKEKMISQLVALAVSKGYAGINIDLESIAYSSDLSESRAAFNLFIHELAVKLHENGKKLIISVAAKVNDDPTNDWSYPFDLASLGEDADYLQLMTYDQHGSWGEPGPVSGADSVGRSDRLHLLGCRPGQTPHRLASLWLQTGICPHQMKTKALLLLPISTGLTYPHCMKNQVPNPFGMRLHNLRTLLIQKKTTAMWLGLKIRRA